MPDVRLAQRHRAQPAPRHVEVLERRADQRDGGDDRVVAEELVELLLALQKGVSEEHGGNRRAIDEETERRRLPPFDPVGEEAAQRGEDDEERDQQRGRVDVREALAELLAVALQHWQRDGKEFGKRFSNVYSATLLVSLFIVLAALRGLFTYGIEGWKAPALSLFIYCAPVPAVLLGYSFLQREEQLYKFFRYYAIITSIALIGTPLEYFNVPWRGLGTVALSEAYIRHLPGLQIRLLSGLYRAPDVMAWHAATLTIIGLIMTLRGKLLRAWPWMIAIGWGFLSCLLSGRRKAVYMVAVFVIIFLWRYMRRLSVAQIVTFVVALSVVGLVVNKIAQDEQ